MGSYSAAFCCDGNIVVTAKSRLQLRYLHNPLRNRLCARPLFVAAFFAMRNKRRAIVPYFCKTSGSKMPRDTSNYRSDNSRQSATEKITELAHDPPPSDYGLPLGMEADYDELHPEYGKFKEKIKF